MGRWIHSHEEDTGEERVFRPATSALPPARGRRQLELRADGRYIESSPGPVDIPVMSTGSWSLEGNELVLTDDAGGSDAVLELVAAEPDRLAIRR